MGANAWKPARAEVSLGEVGLLDFRSERRGLLKACVSGRSKDRGV